MFDFYFIIVIIFLFFSCNYFSQGEITTLGSVGGPDVIRDVVVGMVEGSDIIRDVVVGMVEGSDIIRDVVVGMVETQLYFFLGTKQPGSVKFGIS